MHQARLPCHLNSRASKKVVVGDIVWVWARVLKMSQWFELEILWKEGTRGPVGCKEMHTRGVCVTTSALEKGDCPPKTPWQGLQPFTLEGIYFNLLGVADGWARKGSRLRRKSSTVKVALGALYEFKSHQSNVTAQRVLEKGCGGHHFTDGAHDSRMTLSSLSAGAQTTRVCLRPSTESICGSDPLRWIFIAQMCSHLFLWRRGVKNTGHLNFAWIFISEVFLNVKRSKREVGVGDL